jgi:hypothetical protein
MGAGMVRKDSQALATGVVGLTPVVSFCARASGTAEAPRSAEEDEIREERTTEK